MNANGGRLTTLFAFSICFWLSDALFLELTQVRVNGVLSRLHTIPVGRELRDCLAEAPCFHGLALDVLFLLRPINLDFLGLPLTFAAAVSFVAVISAGSRAIQ